MSALQPRCGNNAFDQAPRLQKRVATSSGDEADPCQTRWHVHNTWRAPAAPPPILPGTPPIAACIESVTTRGLRGLALAVDVRLEGSDEIGDCGRGCAGAVRVTHGASNVHHLHIPCALRCECRGVQACLRCKVRVFLIARSEKSNANAFVVLNITTDRPRTFTWRATTTGLILGYMDLLA